MICFIFVYLFDNFGKVLKSVGFKWDVGMVLFVVVLIKV